MTTTLYVLGIILSLMLGQNQGVSTTPQPTTQKVGDPTAVRMLIKEAKALEPLAKTDWVKRFLAATQDLPAMPSRALLKDEEKKIYFFSRTGRHAWFDLSRQAGDE